MNENLDNLTEFDKAFLRAFEGNKTIWLDLMQIEADDWGKQLEKFTENLTKQELVQVGK